MQMNTVTCNKKVLNPTDDKRVLCDDGVNTIAHGHWRLVESGFYDEFDIKFA